MQNERTHSLTNLRESITNAYRMDETECLAPLILEASLPPDQLAAIAQKAKSLVLSTRDYKKRQGKIDTLLHQYDLSTEEGIALMCLAESLLRIPDTATIDKFISDKLSTVDWKSHLNADQPLFVNAATWGLFLTGKIYQSQRIQEKNLTQILTHTMSRLGMVMVRPIIFQMMKMIGNQFVMGETIQSALKRTKDYAKYRFSFDMLGESARTKEDAKKYFDAYMNAIVAIGDCATSAHPAENPGISIKLSALHPRYEYSQSERIKNELPPLLLALAKKAKQYQLGLTIDAEEADRLDLSLDLFQILFTDPELKDWEGLGLAVQAYQKRAVYVLDWLKALSRQQQKRIMVRLVKGAYWDAEIKQSQVQGLVSYPVFTRKAATDVSFLACAKKMLAARECFYPQFGTHNAYSVAAILDMTRGNTDFEFQCLHGMGESLYDEIVTAEGQAPTCRIYAPVGTHKELLGYLVRRLLENGANTSFVNQLSDDTIPIELLIADPVTRMATLPSKPHPKIPLPQYIYGNWLNSSGVDLSNARERTQFLKQVEEHAAEHWVAHSLIPGNKLESTSQKSILSPSQQDDIVGHAVSADETEVKQALAIAFDHRHQWGGVSVEERALCLERAADLFQQAMATFVSLLIREGGKCIPDAIAEVREAIDYCRYYAYRARQDLVTQTLPGPTGELNQLTLYPRGVFACISPWNFPLAIFTGQVIAALVSGNSVIAKPAEQTPLVAYQAIKLLHQAGIPETALQLLIGRGSVIGKLVMADVRIAGVMFTGSTETAKIIERGLAHREGPIACFVAETGGQNAMIVDSSALSEQTVLDIVASAFNSAGQRCSALRVLFVQEELAPKLLAMLKGYLAEMTLGLPQQLATDVGPIIDPTALKTLHDHAEDMMKQGQLVAEMDCPDHVHGHFFAPRVFELSHLNILEREVFGPILHVIRYQAGDLNKVLDSIIATGYGLTLGVQSRIDHMITKVTSRMPVGNMYVNRNMIGAVVGVQPFGGERLSGTGPKAGGPHYLPRLCTERTVSHNLTAIGGNAKLVSLLEEDE